MTSRPLAVTVDCNDVERCVRFWCAVLDTTVQGRWRDSNGVEYVEVGMGDGPVLLFQPVEEGKQVRNRVHLDVAPEHGSQQAEVERLLGLGASRLADDPAHPWVVLADPEGNEFCVLPPRRTAAPAHDPPQPRYGGASPQPQRGAGRLAGGVASAAELAFAIRVPHST